MFSMFCLRCSGQLGFDEFKELLDEVWKWKVGTIHPPTSA